MAQIICNQKITPHYYRLRLASPEVARKVQPGQFVMVRVTSLFDPLLRRPLSIHKVCTKSGRVQLTSPPPCLEILYRVVGKGTQLLAEKKAGESLDLIGPLGSGFHFPRNAKTVLMIGGGIGIAPLLFLAQRLRKARREVPLFVFIGGEAKGDILCVNDFTQLGATIHITTEDGSRGMRGVVTDLVGQFLRERIPAGVEDVQLYACGPLPMLGVVAALAHTRGLPCQILLESRMACGVGACLGCAIPITTGGMPPQLSYQRVCREGPVFESTAVAWEVLL